MIKWVACCTESEVEGCELMSEKKKGFEILKSDKGKPGLLYSTIDQVIMIIYQSIEIYFCRLIHTPLDVRTSAN